MGTSVEASVDCFEVGCEVPTGLIAARPDEPGRAAVSSAISLSTSTAARQCVVVGHVKDETKLYAGPGGVDSFVTDPSPLTSHTAGPVGVPPDSRQLDAVVHQ